jgi:hypothetical protein
MAPVFVQPGNRTGIGASVVGKWLFAYRISPSTWSPDTAVRDAPDNIKPRRLIPVFIKTSVSKQISNTPPSGKAYREAK